MIVLVAEVSGAMIGAATPWGIWLAISSNRSPTIWRAW